MHQHHREFTRTISRIFVNLQSFAHTMWPSFFSNISPQLDFTPPQIDCKTLRHDHSAAKRPVAVPSCWLNQDMSYRRVVAFHPRRPSGLHSAKELKVPNFGRIVISNDPHGLRVETCDEDATRVKRYMFLTRVSEPSPEKMVRKIAMALGLSDSR